MFQCILTFNARNLFSALLPIIACLLLATSAGAQTTVTGAVEGQVLDSAGNGIPNVRVQIVDTESQVPYEAKTDANGRYSRQQLPPGRYDISVEVPSGYTSFNPNRKVSIFITKTRAVAPAITLTPTLTPAPSPTPVAPMPGTPAEPNEPPLGPRPMPGPSPSPSPVVEEEDISIDINRTDASRGGNYPEKEVSTLPLGSVTLTRSFDELALLLPGVATPPQTQGDVAGPGIGAGVGSAGQFAVNGLRSRANNFTMDGSDNNDEDIGVRRQGFLTLVPQSIESIQEYQVITLLAPAQYGRNFGAQVNAVSKSGTNLYHGTFYGFFNSSQLNARNFFDTTNGNAVTTLRANNQDVVLQTRRATGTTSAPLTVRNGSGGEDSSTFAQAGFVLGGPLVPIDRTNPNPQKSLFFFVSAEGQLLNANKEASFVVPTVAQRGAFGLGATGFNFTDVNGVVRPAPLQSRAGAGVLSLYPFPNNPNGVYGANTFTRTLPASGFGKVVSGKTNGSFYVRGRRQDITARYNFTDDARTIPVTGGAIFSSLRPLVRTQNFSTFLSSEITNTISNEVRASYGRTRLVFDEVPDREFLMPTQAFFNDAREARFLLNATYLANITAPGGPPTFLRRPEDPFRDTSESAIGLVGQVKIGGFSPVGVDVFNFPQSRVNNTYQLADTLNMRYRATHNFAFGADIRRVELNSDLPRNSRPLLVYGGQVGSDQSLGGGSTVLTPVDFAAIGSPSGALQTFSTTGSAAINLRYYEYNFFGQDEWRVRRNLTLSYGVRYEYNSPPNELNRRIESTFNSPSLSLLPGLRTFLAGRTRIFDPDRNNIAPRVGLAYARRLFGGERETVFRAGYGMYYDQVLGAVVSQSRNVFPNFLTLNYGGGSSQFGDANLDLFNPSSVGFCRNADCSIFDRFRAPGTLNQINPAVASTFAGFVGINNQFFPTAGFGVTLPERRIKTPMAQHYSFTVEQPLGRSMVVSAAYVGTSGRHLLRLTTPNAGENVQLIANRFVICGTSSTGASTCVNPVSGFFPGLIGDVFSPSSPDTPTFTRRTAGVGAVNLIQTSANSRYDSLQVQVRGRYARGVQYQAAYTFSKATDDVSDVFDLAGAPALPQDSEHLEAERGPSNFDVRHRVSYNLIYSLPTFSDRSAAARAVFGGLEIASTGEYQSAQPFTVNSIFDVNGDGNFTDRLNTTNGLARTGDRQRPLRLTTGNTTSLLAGDFENGRTGRNTFRASNLLLFNLAIVKNFAITERQKLTVRTEIFNLTDRANFGIPVRFLEAPGFGQATDTVTPGRRIQFALKYSF